MILEVCTVSTIQRTSGINLGDLTRLPAASVEVAQRLQAATAEAARRDIEWKMLAAVWGFYAGQDTVTIHKSRSVGTSEAGARCSLFDTPGTTKPILRPRDPRGTRAHRRRTHALSRGRQGRKA